MVILSSITFVRIALVEGVEGCGQSVAIIADYNKIFGLVVGPVTINVIQGQDDGIYEGISLAPVASSAPVFGFVKQVTPYMLGGRTIKNGAVYFSD